MNKARSGNDVIESHPCAPLTRDRLVELVRRSTAQFRRRARRMSASSHASYHPRELEGLESLRLPARNARAQPHECRWYARRIAVIAGAGPAGLTAALELLRRSDITPDRVRGRQPSGWDLEDRQLPRQSNGPRRSSIFFEVRLGHALVAGNFAGRPASQSEPDEACESPTGGNRAICARALMDRPHRIRVMLVRQRLSRIFHRRRFFDYPLKLNANTLRNMGLMETLRIGVSYASGTTHSSISGNLPGGFSGQSLWRAALPYFFQGLHRKGVGRSLRRDLAPSGARSGSRVCR